MTRLRDVLWPNGEVDWKPLVVSCANCGMTMWATSENAHLGPDGDFIYCTDCLPVSQPVEAPVVHFNVLSLDRHT